MRKTWPVLLIAALSCARKPGPQARPAPEALVDEGKEVEELARDAPVEEAIPEEIVTDDPLFLRIQEVEELAARMRAEGVSDPEAQLRACIAEEDLLPAPDTAELSDEETARLGPLQKLAGAAEKEVIRAAASASGSPAFRKEALRVLAKLLRRSREPFEVIAAIEKFIENLPRTELPNDLIPTLLGHAGLFHLYDARVRLASARILGRLADPRAVPFLKRARALHPGEELDAALKACSSAAR